MSLLHSALFCQVLPQFLHVASGEWKNWVRKYPCCILGCSSKEVHKRIAPWRHLSFCLSLMVRKEKKRVGGETDLKLLCVTIYLPCVHASHSYSWVTAMDALKVLRVLRTNPSKEELFHGMLKTTVVSSLLSSHNNITSLLLLATSALPFHTCS